MAEYDDLNFKPAGGSTATLPAPAASTAAPVDHSDLGFKPAASAATAATVDHSDLGFKPAAPSAAVPSPDAGERGDFTPRPIDINDTRPVAPSDSTQTLLPNGPEIPPTPQAQIVAPATSTQTDPTTAPTPASSQEFATAADVNAGVGGTLPAPTMEYSPTPGMPRAQFDARYTQQQQANAAGTGGGSPINPRELEEQRAQQGASSFAPINAAVQTVKGMIGSKVGVVDPEALRLYQHEQAVEHPVKPSIVNTIGGIAGGAAKGIAEYVAGGTPLMTAEAGLEGAGESRAQTAQARDEGQQITGGTEAARAVGAGSVDASTAAAQALLLGGRGASREVLPNAIMIGGLSGLARAIKNLISGRPMDEGVKEEIHTGALTQLGLHGAMEAGKMIGERTGMLKAPPEGSVITRQKPASPENANAAEAPSHADLGFKPTPPPTPPPQGQEQSRKTGGTTNQQSNPPKVPPKEWDQMTVDEIQREQQANQPKAEPETQKAQTEVQPPETGQRQESTSNIPAGRKAAQPESQATVAAASANVKSAAPVAAAGTQARVEGEIPSTENLPKGQQPEKISLAAVKHLPTGEVFTGVDHGEAFNAARAKVDVQPGTLEEGFTTDRGRFVSREDAVGVAKAAGQAQTTGKTLDTEDIKQPQPSGVSDAGLRNPPEERPVAGGTNEQAPSQVVAGGVAPVVREEGAQVGAQSRDVGGEVKSVEPAFKHRSTQTNIPSESDAGKSVDAVRAQIPDNDLAGDGRDVGGNHVTVRYGLKDGTDVGGVREYLRSLAPFDATLGKTDIFPPSESSDAAAVVQAPVNAPQLHQINDELAKRGEFTEPTFKDYKPHATIAYVKPEAAEKYKGSTATEGKKFRVTSIAITDRNGNQEEVPLAGKQEPGAPGGIPAAVRSSDKTSPESSASPTAQASNPNADLVNLKRADLVSLARKEGVKASGSSDEIRQGIAAKRNTAKNAPPKAKREVGPKQPAGLTKADYEKELLDTLDTEEDQRFGYRAESVTGEHGDIGARGMTFLNKLPDEVKDLPANVRRLLRTTSNADEAHGENTMAQMGETEYLARLEQLAQGRINRALEAAKRSPNPRDRWQAATYETFGKGKQRPQQEKHDAGAFRDGTEFSVNGRKVDVRETEEGFKVLEDGPEFPVVPAEEIGQIAIDAGSIKESEPVSAFDPNDEFAPAEVHDVLVKHGANEEKAAEVVNEILAETQSARQTGETNATGEGPQRRSDQREPQALEEGRSGAGAAQEGGARPGQQVTGQEAPAEPAAKFKPLTPELQKMMQERNVLRTQLAAIPEGDAPEFSVAFKRHEEAAKPLRDRIKELDEQIGPRPDFWKPPVRKASKGAFTVNKISEEEAAKIEAAKPPEKFQLRSEDEQVPMFGTMAPKAESKSNDAEMRNVLSKVADAPDKLRPADVDRLMQHAEDRGKRPEFLDWLTAQTDVNPRAIQYARDWTPENQGTPAVRSSISPSPESEAAPTEVAPPQTGKLDKLEAWATARLAEKDAAEKEITKQQADLPPNLRRRKGSFGALDPERILLKTVQLAARFAKGFNDRAVWIKEQLAEHGDEVKKHLGIMWMNAKRLAGMDETARGEWIASRAAPERLASENPASLAKEIGKLDNPDVLAGQLNELRTRALSARAGSEQAQGIAKELAKIAKENLPSTLTGKLLGEVAKAGSLRDIARGIDKVSGILQEHLSREASDELYSHIGKPVSEKPAGAGGKTLAQTINQTTGVNNKPVEPFAKGQINPDELRPEHRDALKPLVDSLRAKGKESASGTGTLADFIQSETDAGRSNAFSPAELVQLRQTDGKPVSNLEPEQMKLLSNAIRHTAFLSNEFNAKESAGRVQQLLQKAKEIGEGILKWQPKNRITSAGIGEKPLLARTFGDAQRDLSRLTGVNGGPQMEQHIYKPLAEGESDARLLKWQGIDAVREIEKQHGVKQSDLVKMANQQERIRLPDGRSVFMTAAERMHFMASYSDPNTRKAFDAGSPMILSRFKGQSVGNVKITPDVAQAIIDTATPFERDVVKAGKDFINGDLAKSINDASLKDVGFERATGKDYFPRSRDLEQSRDAMPPGQKGWYQAWLEDLGLLKARVRSRAPIVIGDFYNTYQRHIDMASRYAHVAEPIRDILMLTSKSSDGVGIGQDMEAHLGGAFGNRLNHYLQQVSGMSQRDVMFGGLSRVLQRAISVKELGFRLSSAINHFAGGSLFMNDMTGPESAAFARQIVNPKNLTDSGYHQKIQAESGYFRERAEQGGTGLESPTADTNIDKLAKSQIGQALRKLGDISLSGLKYGDARDIVALTKSLESTYKTNHPTATADEAFSNAVKRAEYIVRRNGTTSSPLDMSYLALRMKEMPGVNLLTMFTSKLNKLHNVGDEAIAKFRVNKDTGAVVKAAGLIGLNAMVVASVRALFKAQRAGFNPPQTRQKEHNDLINEIAEPLAELMDTITLGGGQIVRGISAKLQGRNPVTGSMVGDMINSAGDAVTNGAKAIRKGDERGAVRNAIGLISQIPGLPLDAPLSYAEGIYRMIAGPDHPAKAFRRENEAAADAKKAGVKFQHSAEWRDDQAQQRLQKRQGGP